jgi:integrase
MLASAGHQPFTRITKAAIVAGCERRTPSQAKHFMDTVRGVFRWAVDAGLAKVDPTAGVSYPKIPDSDGFPPWSEDDVALYEKRWPIGTRERVWLDVLLYTGLRPGDAVRLGKQHVRNSIATIKTEKTGTEVTLPILPVLEQTIAAGPCGDLAFIVSAAGKPFQKHSFGNAFAAAARKAGISTACASSARPAQRMPARLPHNSRPSSDGPAIACLRSIPAPPIAAGLRSKEWRSLRTGPEHLFPHLSPGCGDQRK